MWGDHIFLPPRLSPGLAAHDMGDESLLIYYGTSRSLAVRDNVVEGEVTSLRKTWLEDPSKEAPPFSLPFPAHNGAYSDVPKAGDSPLGILAYLEPPDLT